MNPAVIIKKLLDALLESRCSCHDEEFPDQCDWCADKSEAIEEAKEYLAL